MPSATMQLSAAGILDGIAPYLFESGHITAPTDLDTRQRAQKLAAKAAFRSLNPFLFVVGPGRLRLIALGKGGADILTDAWTPPTVKNTTGGQVVVVPD